MIKSANPALTTDTFRGLGRVQSYDDVMTVQGTVYKTLTLLFLVLLSSGWMWSKFYVTHNIASITTWTTVGVIAGFILSLVIIFKKEWAPLLSPVYALCQGLFLGGISAIFEVSYPGIVIQAVALTFGTLACMLFLYQTGWIRATEKFKLGVFAATGAIALLYFVSIILSFFHINMAIVYGNGAFSIGLSVFIVAIAALNLVIDFDFIEQGARQAVPKYMEWYGAFALMVTLIWLYLEIIRLLSKINSRE